MDKYFCAGCKEYHQYNNTSRSREESRITIPDTNKKTESDSLLELMKEDFVGNMHKDITLMKKDIVGKQKSHDEYENKSKTLDYFKMKVISHPIKSNSYATAKYVYPMTREIKFSTNIESIFKRKTEEPDNKPKRTKLQNLMSTQEKQIVRKKLIKAKEKLLKIKNASQLGPNERFNELGDKIYIMPDLNYLDELDD